jgi:WD40 repeat protein/energy-coupling factor transporter ATP-binding protein EcfA2
MSENRPQSGADNRQSQDVDIGRDLRVEGKGHQVDFSQTHIETQIIQQVSEVAVQSHPLITASPYKGLKKFETTDHQRFFGRESLIADLLSHLDAHPWLLLLGASGSGKSSLVRAGIIPKLAEQQGTQLIDLTFTPDEDPFDSLYASLLGHFKQAEAKLARQGEPDTLVQVVRQLQAADTPWVIFVDQFEELFTISHPQKRETFITSLINLQRTLAQRQSANKTARAPLYLILAMRADFLDQFAPYRELGQLTERYMRFITNMTRDDLQRAIANPANLHGVAYQEGLLKEILNDLQDQPGELPLLQYTLDLLWKRANLEDRLICCDTYWAINGVQGALRQHVTEIYDALSEPDQARARQIFLSLVDTSTNRENPEGSAKAVSRRAYLSQFTDPETRRVLTKLIDANLLVSGWRQSGGDIPEQRETSVQLDASNNDATARQATVELAHETLIRSWPLLQTWLEENQEIINLKHRLADEARRWHTLAQASADQAKDELWRGSKLERVEELRRDGVFDTLFGGLEATEAEFMDAGVAERDRLHRQEEERQREKEAQRQKELRYYRNMAAGAITALAITVGLGTATALAWRSAERQEINALITAAEAKFVDDPHSLDTLVAAMEAGNRLQHSLWFSGNADLRADARQVVSQAVYWVREQGELVGHSQFVESVAISPDEDPQDQIIATAGRDGTVRLWTTQGAELETLMDQDRPFSYVKFSPDGSRLAMADYDGKVTLWSRPDGSLQPLGNGENAHQKTVREVSFHPTEERLATVSDDGTVKIWNFNGESRQTLALHQARVDAVAYSPDGQFLVTGGDDKQVIVWDNNGTPVQTINDFPSAISHLNFTTAGQWLAPGTWLAIAMDDGTVEIWQFEPDGPTLSPSDITLNGHSDEVTAVQFSPDGTLIITTSVDGTTKVWNRFGQELYTLKSHDGRVNNLALNRDGSLLATSSNDGTAKIWQLNSPFQHILIGHQDVVNGISFSNNGILATSSADARVLIWDINNTDIDYPRILQASAYINNVAISSSDQYLAAALLNGMVEVWDIQQPGNNQAPFAQLRYGEVAGDLQFMADDETLIAIGYLDPFIKFWNVNNQSLINFLEFPDQDRSESFTLSLSPSETTLATANQTGTISLWNLENGELETLYLHDQPVYRVLFSPDEESLVTASEDTTVRVWDLGGELQRELNGHNAGIWGLAISKDGYLIASGSKDSTAIVWTMEGERLLQLVGHKEAVNMVSFSPDANWLATGSEDNTVILWNIENTNLNSWLEEGCSWLTQRRHEQTANSYQTAKTLCKNSS